MVTINSKDKIYSVDEIVMQIKVGLEKQYSFVIIEGEVTNYSKHAASGHIYFGLSDGVSLLQCVCWKSVSIPVLADGMKVYCSGKVTAYTGRSQFQLNILAISVSGKGNLFKLFEDMKAKLAAEGLFDDSRKKQIPSMPKTIGIITAADGDALQDILARLKERVSCKVIVWSVQVQGVKASGMIAEAIAGFNDMALSDVKKPDVIILARGGGSMEDLWAFNEEGTVRAIAASHIPVVSAIGHEMDYTLADLVSDKRAPTPTASIEMLLPTRIEMQDRVDKIRMFIDKIVQEQVNKSMQYVGMLADMHGNMVESLYVSRAQQLDYLTDGLECLINQKIVNMIERLPSLWDLSGTYKFYLEQFSGRQESLYIKLNKIINDKIMRLSNYEDLMRSFSYENVLNRGFCMSNDSSGHIIMDAKSAKAANKFSVKFSDDSINVMVDKD